MQATAIIDQAGDLIVTGTTDAVPWWSFTKTVLAVAALRLVEHGSLNLDEPRNGERFSLRHLLRHQAGLPDYGGLPKYHADVAAGKTPWPTEQLLAALDATRLRYEPGNDWSYSNVGYLKVAQLIEFTSGLTLEAALRQIVFEPAKTPTARLATQMTDLVDVQMGNLGSYHPGWVYHGLVVGNVTDAARLLRALMTGNLVKADTLAEMVDGHSLPLHRGDRHPHPAYGLGVMLWAEDPMNHSVGHMGEGPGSQIAVLAKGQKAVSVWTALPSTLSAEDHAFSLLA